jgi:anti-sigma-K factor RskA
MTANHLELTLAGSYVLGTLDVAEHDAFVAHLRTCAECQQEVRSLQPVAEALAASVPTRTPRPELRQRVLTQVSRADSTEGTRRAAVTPRSRWWAEPRTWLPVAALLIASLGLGVYAQRLHSRIDSLEARLDAALRDAESSRTALAEARGVAGRAQNAMAVLASPDMARIDLAGQADAPSARARAFWSRNRGLVFTATNLPPLQPGRVYQIWVLTKGAPISAGLVRPDDLGGTTAVLGTAPDIPQPAGVAVSLEPAGGVPAPTGAIYLAGTVL